jgi:SAM-dependent methyltransferase
VTAPESPIARGFDDVAADYVDTTPQARRLVDLADLRPGERVLDAGCGPGTVTVLAADRVGPAGRVLGVDLAEAMLVRARAAVAGRDNVEIRAMDVTALDLADGDVDAVVANSVLPAPALTAFRHEFLARVADARSRARSAGAALDPAGARTPRRRPRRSPSPTRFQRHLPDPAAARGAASPAYVELLWQHAAHDRSVPEAARRAGVPVATAYRLRARAADRLHDLVA